MSCKPTANCTKCNLVKPLPRAYWINDATRIARFLCKSCIKHKYKTRRQNKKIRKCEEHYISDSTMETILNIPLPNYENVCFRDTMTGMHVHSLMCQLLLCECVL